MIAPGHYWNVDGIQQVRTYYHIVEPFLCFLNTFKACVLSDRFRTQISYGFNSTTVIESVDYNQLQHICTVIIHVPYTYIYMCVLYEKTLYSTQSIILRRKIISLTGLMLYHWLEITAGLSGFTRRKPLILELKAIRVMRFLEILFQILFVSTCLSTSMNCVCLC